VAAPEPPVHRGQAAGVEEAVVLVLLEPVPLSFFAAGAASVPPPPPPSDDDEEDEDEDEEARLSVL
jgi:hypothetical protein